MKRPNWFGSLLFSVGLAAVTMTAGCSRHKQEAVILANKADQAVDLDPNGAIQSYEQAVSLDGSNHRILYKLALAYKKTEKWDKVASTLARATEIAPSYANYWLERAMALLKQARDKKISSMYDEAKEPFQKCIENDVNKDACYYFLGEAYLYTDDEEKALANFTKAIEHRPTKINYYTRLADLYQRLDMDKEAEQVLNAAKGLAKPKDKALANVHTLLSGIYSQRKDINKAVAELEAAKGINPNDAGLLFSLGMAYAKLTPPKKEQSLAMLKNFASRGCKGKKAKKYRSECEAAQSTIQSLSGPGG